MSGSQPPTVILHHTPTDANVPALLFAGETAWATGPTRTKLWIGDGTINRLLLSTNAADLPLIQGVPIVADSAPVNAAANTLWWDSSTGRLFIWFVGSASSAWVEVGAHG